MNTKYEASAMRMISAWGFISIAAPKLPPAKPINSVFARDPTITASKNKSSDNMTVKEYMVSGMKKLPKTAKADTWKVSADMSAGKGRTFPSIHKYNARVVKKKKTWLSTFAKT